MGVKTEALKKLLPVGYEKLIAESLGCSTGTVGNILSNRGHKSKWSLPVLNETTRLASIEAKKIEAAKKAANKLNELIDGTAS
ncbi:MAG: hypothetical protein ACRCZZ_04835 [Phocaeicola sp.]